MRPWSNRLAADREWRAPKTVGNNPPAESSAILSGRVEQDVGASRAQGLTRVGDAAREAGKRSNPSAMAIGSAASQSEAGRTTPPRRLPRSRTLARAGALLCFGIAYFLAVSTIERVTVSPQLASVAASTFLLIALLLAERPRRWRYLLVALVAHFAAHIPIDAPDRLALEYLASAAPALIAAVPIWRLDLEPPRFDSVHTTGLLIVFGAVIGPAVASVLMPAAGVGQGVGQQELLNSPFAALLRAFVVLTVVPAVINGVAQARARHASGGLIWASTASLLTGAIFLWTFRDEADPLCLGSLLVLLAGTVLLLAVSLRERRATQRELDAANDRFQGVFEQHVMPMALWRDGSSALRANRAFMRLVGANAEDRTLATLIGVSRDTLEQPVDVGAAAADPLTRFRQSTKVLQLGDGRNVPVVLGQYEAEAAREGVIYALDLSAFRNAEMGRQQAESLHAAVLDSLHEEIAIVDAKGEVIEINRSWRKAAENAGSKGGVPLVAGSNLLEACKKEASRGNPDAGNELRALKAVLDGSEIRCQLEQVGGAPGAATWLEVTIEKLRRAEGGAVITRADVTSRKRAELEARMQRQQLTHLGRVAILGQLSGAFAHELNQPLTSILGNAEAALRLLAPTAVPAEVQEILRDIIDEDLRAAQVIQRLRALLDKGESVREPVNLNSTVHEVLSLCKSELIARNVRVQTDLDPAIPAVMADRVQMQQIILNLLMNACDAMADHPVAERTVALATRVSMEPLSVELSISDSGSGIADEDLERIFHPFVTSKPHGMGLGLAICRSVAESHGGRLWAGNIANGGAVFHLILPAGGALS